MSSMPLLMSGKRLRTHCLVGSVGRTPTISGTIFLPCDTANTRREVRNELAPLMLERLIALATNPGDLVIDPFGGSGTTFYAAERLERRWLGSEIGDIEPAVQRLSDLAAGIDIRWERSRGAKGRRGASKEQLGLNEAREVLSGFLLTVMEKKDSNGGAALREAIDRRFQEAGGWTKKQTGDVDWTKCHRVNGTEVC
jgi:hypothetical protein